MLETGEWFDAPEQLSVEGTPPASPPQPAPYSEASQAAQIVYIKPAPSASARGMQPPGARCLLCRYHLQDHLQTSPVV